MRAALLEAQGQPMRMVEGIEIEEPRAGQVRVKISNCGVCHTDVSNVDGVFPSAVPVILGHEAAGVVDALGPNVDGLQPGDHVVLTACPPCGACRACVRGEFSLCVNGGGIMSHTFYDGTTGLSLDGAQVYRGVGVGAFGEYVVTPASGAVKLPSDVPLDVVCVIGCAVQTGVGAVLNTARVEAGSTVLVTGLGGVGLSTVQGARIAGAARIIASDPVEDRRRVAASFGATDLIDPTAEDLVARATELSGGGVDYAFETAGLASLILEGINACRPGGTTVCIGAPAMNDALTIPVPAILVATEKKLVGSLLGSCNALHDIPRFVALWRAGLLDLEGLITARRPLAEVNQAMDDLRAGRGIRTVLSI